MCDLPSTPSYFLPRNAMIDPANSKGEKEPALPTAFHAAVAILIDDTRGDDVQKTALTDLSGEQRSGGDTAPNLVPALSLPKGGGAIRGIGDKFGDIAE